MTPTTANELSKAVKHAFLNSPYEFRPCALFDERLDCIRVIARDCSVTEVRIDNRITVLEDDSTHRYVGFTIAGARRFCQEQGFNLAVPVKLADLLDRILAGSTDPIVALAIKGIAKRIVEEERIEPVDLSHGSVVQKPRTRAAGA